MTAWEFRLELEAVAGTSGIALRDVISAANVLLNSVPTMSLQQVIEMLHAMYGT